MSETLLKEISKKLDTLIALMASQGKSRDEQIHILSSLGFTNVEISQLIGVPKGTIDGIRAKKKKKK
jgi:hypothetical protein